MGKYREAAVALVAQMTLEEKVSQTLYNAPAIERLGIPAYNWWNEALHGVARAGTATVFPQSIGVAATFDQDLIEEMASAIALEARAKYHMQSRVGDRDIYKGLTFWSPNVNIFRDPRWGRGQETYGEDPWLTSRLGVRFVQGLQGREPDCLKAAACAKHFAVHSGPEESRHRFDAQVSRQDLYETYLPAFRACVQEAKVEAVMGAYNRTNGEPCCGSRTLLLDILRREWGFEGHVVSDCGALQDFHEHHKVTKNPVESATMAMNNGCDLNCGCMFPYLRDAVRGGYVEEARLDEAVANLMETRMKLGILEGAEKSPLETVGYERVDCQEHRNLNRRIARESLVLLKNKDHILPLDPDKLSAVAVIGPNANSRRALVGNYEGTASRYVTVLEGIQDYLGDRVRVYYSQGCHLYRDHASGEGRENDRLSEVKAVCANSDVVIAVMGLDGSIEGEEGDAYNEFSSGDKYDLQYPGLQPEILRAAKESGKPVILISMTGSAMALTWENENLDAILQAWYPGAEGGRAVAELLFGEFSPEGKLPVTFYRTTEELPDFTDYGMEGRTYRYMHHEALFPFGFGLSYTQFALENVALDQRQIEAGGKIGLCCTVKNTGDREGSQTLQVYVKALREGTPNAQLKGLAKVRLAAGEKQEISLELLDKAFALYDREGQLVLEEGAYAVYVGMQQPDKRSEALTGQRCVSVEVTCKERAVL